MKKNYRMNIKYLILGIIICIFLLATTISVISKPYMQAYTEELDAGWLVSHVSQDNYSVSNNIKNIYNAKPNEDIYIKRVLDTDITNPVLIIRSNLHSISVQIDSSVIYASSNNEKNPGKSLHIIPLKDEYKGKELIIKENCPFKFYAKDLGEIYLSAPESVTSKILLQSYFDMMIGVILIVIGLLQAFMILFMRLDKNDLANGIIYFCIISLLIGTIFILNNPIINIFINPSVIINLQLLCLYVCPLFFLFMVKQTTRYKSVNMKYSLVTNTLFVDVVIFCVISHIIQLPSLIYLFIIISILNSIHITYIYVKSSNKDIIGKRKKRYMFSFLLLAFTLAMHILYLLNKRYHFIPINIGIYKFIIVYAMLYYATYYYLNLCSRLINVNSIIKNNQSLKSIAYNDKLTNLRNRYSFETNLDDMSGNRLVDGSTAIFVFDLNRLKFINDKYGHSTGDKYIQLCATCLAQTFSSTDLIYRIGGDEFVVILDNISYSQVDLLSQELGKRLESEKFIGSSLSLAYGYAIYDKFLDNNSLKNTFNRADKKMYACKTKQKEL